MKKDSSKYTINHPFLTFGIVIIVFVGLMATTSYTNISTFELMLPKTQYIFGQSSVVTSANLVSDQNNTIKYNTYENSEIGISIKYPSNFLIDESNSNQTVSQVSFFPSYDPEGLYPDSYLSWFDIYVESFYPPILNDSSSDSHSSSSINLSSYLKDLANSFQEQNEDVTIIEASSKDMLSGYPAYKLITRSFSGNTSIDDVEIGTIVGNNLYSLNYQVNTLDYEKALPIANKMIYSFEILNNGNNITKTIELLTNSTEFSAVKDKIPIIGDFVNSLTSNNLSNSSNLFFGDLNRSILNSLQNIFQDSVPSSSLSQDSPPSNATLSSNSSSSLNLESLCGNDSIFKELCRGNTLFGILNDSSNVLFNSENETSSGLKNSLSDTLNNSSIPFNLSELNQLLGPFKITQ